MDALGEREPLRQEKSLELRTVNAWPGSSLSHPSRKNPQSPPDRHQAITVKVAGIPAILTAEQPPKRSWSWSQEKHTCGFTRVRAGEVQDQQALSPGKTAQRKP